MEHKIISKKNNKLLGREEYILEVSSHNNPTKKEIIEMLKLDENLAVVKKIKGKFGRKVFDVEVVSYDTKEIKDKVERLSQKERQKIAQEAKKVSDAAKAEVAK